MRLREAKAVDISKKLEDYASEEGYGVGSYFTQKKNLVIVWSMITTSDEMMAVLKASHKNYSLIKAGECTVYNIHWRVTTFPGTAMCKSVSVPCLSARQVFIQAGYETLCVLYTWCEAFLCTDGLDSLNILITLNCLN